MRATIAPAFWFLSLVFILQGVTPASGQTRPANLITATPEQVGMSGQKLGRVRTVLQAVVARNQTPGVVVLVARRGKVVLLEAAGKMDLDSGRPMRPDAIFRMRSMSKPITTAAALLLVDEGKLALDAPVSRYLPEFKGMRVYVEGGPSVEVRREMTVRDLMRHTAGLSYGYSGSPVDKLYSDNKLLDGTLAEMAGKLARLPLQDQPGARFRYSFATDLLGAVIEVVSKQPLDTFLAERVFRPLDMGDTGFMVPAEKLDRFTASYRSDGRGTLKLLDPPGTSKYRNGPRFLSGGAGLVTTAADYYRFCQMLLNGGELNGKRLLRPETARAMTTNQLPPELLPISLGGVTMPGHGIGLGLLVRMDAKPPSPADGEWSWSGAASTFFWAAPKSELIVIILQQVEPNDITLMLALKPGIYAAIAD